MTFRINPILNKELKLGSRSVKMPIALAVYGLVMTFITVMTLCGGMFSVFDGMVSEAIDYRGYSSCFLTMTFFQLVGICIITPSITASSIAGEREKQTLDIMLTTPVSPFSIVMGKLMATLANVFLFIISGLPAMSLCFMYGGIKWTYLFVFLAGAMVVAFFVGAIGVWSSAMFKKTVAAIIISLIIECVFFFGTFIVFSIFIGTKVSAYYAATVPNPTMDLGISPIVLLFNPASGILNALYSAEGGFNILGNVFGNETGSMIKVSGIVELLSKQWSLINFVLLILMGFGFAALAALKIDSARRKSGRRK